MQSRSFGSRGGPFISAKAWKKSGIPGKTVAPVRSRPSSTARGIRSVLIAMGTPMFDNCDLEPLSKAAADRHRWEFMLTAAPLAVPKGTGSPLNPIAIF